MKLPIEIYDKISFLLDFNRGSKISKYYKKKIVTFADKHDVETSDISDFIVLCLEKNQMLMIKCMWFCNNVYQKEAVIEALLSYRDFNTIKKLYNMTYKIDDYFLKDQINQSIQSNDVTYFELLCKYITLSKSELTYLLDTSYFSDEIHDKLIKKIF